MSRGQAERPTGLTHVGPEGEARMVDVSAKAVSGRLARAGGAIRMRPETLSAIREAGVAKGDVLGVARVAGIMAAKRTAELIPLCHSLSLDDVQVRFDLDDALPGVRVEATARTTARTGVEMEAMVAASMALLTIYDMAKGLDRGMVVEQVRLLEKSGGRSGHWVAEAGESRGSFSDP